MRTNLTRFPVRILALGTALWLAQAAPAFTLDAQQLDAFVAGVAERHAFSASELRAVFADASGKQSIIDAITRPAERKPWHEYRKIFLTSKRIEGGVSFWQENADILERARQRWGVAPEVIVAIIGVETLYGRNTGSYRVIDALSTLAFHYPKRSAFFTSELEQFLLLTREEAVDPLSLTGSYAGAMGMPQFISSSYRRYAVDFNDDGHRDIWKNIDDVIGSVANYLAVHGWQPGEAITAPAAVSGDAWPTVVEQGLKPAYTLAELRGLGVTPARETPYQGRSSLIELEQPAGSEHWLGFQNFYAITRYNHSALYAMAVTQLAERIRDGYAPATRPAP